MFFEGSEKKIEVIFNSSTKSLRTQPEQLWSEVVEAAGAKILSKISNEEMDAYLLSESSLFVYDHYLVMITCGTTHLVQAVQKLMQTFKSDQVDAFFYERKNEIFPHGQPSHFFEDAKQLNQWFAAESMRFGREDEHHLYLYSSTKEYKPEDSDHTMEILMHGVNPSLLENFRDCKGCNKEELRRKSRIAEIVKGKIDDFVFEPMGYSLNAIDGSDYYTIHITPESVGNYTSFETNAFSSKEQSLWAAKVLSVFQPQAFDLMLFNKEATEIPEFEGYNLKRSYREEIDAGYCAEYFSYYLPQEETLKPIRF